ncbi:MAG: hypothetical protein ACIALR_14295, partial [Blastopirellula sp. JB062]
MSFKPDEQIDLHNCDREPIHIPGTIQPHGILLAFDAQSLTLSYWSQNAEQALERKVRANATPEQIFNAHTAAAIRQISAEAPAVVVP